LYRLARMKKGLTQKQAAELLKISSAYLCKIEKKQDSPSLEVLVKMRRLYEDYTLA